MEKSPNPAEVLAFWNDAGVDTMLDDEPVDRFALSQALAEARRKPAAPAPQTAPAARQVSRTAAPKIADEGALREAQQAAREAHSLEDLRAAMESFDGCNLKPGARNLVFGDGNPKASVMLVGEAPGRDEDATGTPFVGRSGQLLDRMLRAVDLDRTQVYISNVIPWRPPGNRTPTPLEAALCRPFIERHIELAGPDGDGPLILALLGGSAAKTLLDTKAGIMGLRGKWTKKEVAGRMVPVLPTLHPAYLLRQPAHKRLAWHDLLSLREKLDTLG